MTLSFDSGDPSASFCSDPDFEPLISECHRVGHLHLSLFGSAVRRSLKEVADVDVHLVIRSMDKSAFESLIGAAEMTVRGLAAQVGRPWRLECRHGAFKPAPAQPRELQLHLLVDDGASVGRVPCALLFQRAATGRLLSGESLMRMPTDCGSTIKWLEQAREELRRWRTALATGEIPFRQWVFEPAPRLIEDRTSARTDWDLGCLLRAAATATDLCYRGALWVADWPAAEDSGRGLLSQIHPRPPWQSLTTFVGSCQGPGHCRYRTSSARPSG